MSKRAVSVVHVDEDIDVASQVVWVMILEKGSVNSL